MFSVFLSPFFSAYIRPYYIKLYLTSAPKCILTVPISVPLHVMHINTKRKFIIFEPQKPHATVPRHTRPLRVIGYYEKECY